MLALPAISELQVQQILGYIPDIVATTCIFCAGRPVTCPERPFSWPVAARTPRRVMQGAIASSGHGDPA